MGVSSMERQTDHITTSELGTSWRLRKQRAAISQAHIDKELAAQIFNQRYRALDLNITGLIDLQMLGRMPMVTSPSASLVARLPKPGRSMADPFALPRSRFIFGEPIKLATKRFLGAL
jgi:hypothetical protein